MILILLVLLFQPTQMRADEQEAKADNALIRELEMTQKYRIYQGDRVNRILFVRAIDDVGLVLLEQCIYNGKRTCKFLIDLLATNKRAKPATKCYGIMIAGYTCEKYEDIESCRIYKMHQKYCKHLELTSP